MVHGLHQTQNNYSFIDRGCPQHNIYINLMFLGVKNCLSAYSKAVDKFLGLFLCETQDIQNDLEWDLVLDLD